MPSDYGIPTLGWGFLAWCEAFLAQPDGLTAGQPWRWTDSQARLLAWWFTVDRQGAFLFRRAQIVLPKGAGKSPLAAALSCGALGAPTVFDGFDADGEAVGRPHPSPHVQLAAVSQDQTDNTMSLVLAMLREGEASRELPDLDLGITRVRTRNGKLEPVTASAPSREGQRLTDAILDEPHLWLDSNGGTRMASTLRRNLGKMGGRSVETTNCWVPGENSVAQLTAEFADLIEQDKTKDVGLMRYHPKAEVEDLSDEEAVRAALKELYRDSPWIDIDRIMSEINDPGTHPSDARRFYLNQTNIAEDGWIADHEWAACKNEHAKIEPGDTITLGFDGSRKRTYKVTDSTVLVGCRVSDGHLFTIAHWDQPEGPEGKDWEVPTTEVDAAVATAFETYNVVGFYADSALWETWVASWEARFGKELLVGGREHPIEYRMNRPIVVESILEQFYTAVMEQELSHDNSYILTSHMLHARRRWIKGKFSIAKENPDSQRKIDAAIAAVLAHAAYLDAVAKGVNNQSTKYVPKRIR